MTLQLVGYHRRGPRLENPSLTEVLKAGVPFVFYHNLPVRHQGTKYERKFKDPRLSFVFGQLDKTPDFIMHHGIWILDREDKCSYWLKKGETSFEKHDRVIDPFNADKFSIYGAEYEYTDGLDKLTQEFEELGFSFP